MIHVFLHKDWNFPDIRRQSPKGTGIWGEIRVSLQHVLSADLVVVLNSPVRPFVGWCRKGGLWLFSQESPVAMYRWHTRSFSRFDRVFSYWGQSISPNIIHEQTALPWHINKTYDELRAVSDLEDRVAKRDAVSWVTSSASSKPGHTLRLDFLRFLQENHFPFSLFGRGFDPIADKFDGIHPYKYSIAIENYQCPDYWTEKIADCFLSRTMPIYWGASNITRYFPERSMVLIDPANPEGALRKINDALDADLFTKNYAYIEEARELVLEKYQFFPHLERLLKKYPLGERKKFYMLPANHAPRALP